MIPSVEPFCLDKPEWEQYCKQMAEAKHLSCIVWIALQMGLFIARQLVEGELGHRAAQATVWGNCVKCGTRLHSKGWQGRSLETVVGKVD